MLPPSGPLPAGVFTFHVIPPLSDWLDTTDDALLGPHPYNMFGDLEIAVPIVDHTLLGCGREIFHTAKQG